MVKCLVFSFNYFFDKTIDITGLFFINETFLLKINVNIEFFLFRNPCFVCLIGKSHPYWIKSNLNR